MTEIVPVIRSRIAVTMTATIPQKVSNESCRNLLEKKEASRYAQCTNGLQPIPLLNCRCICSHPKIYLS